MCRFVLYLGEDPVLLNTLVTQPVNSLIQQSLQSDEGYHPYNADGFGIAWYAPEIRPEPARFRSLQPAWSNQNLLSLAEVIRSHCLLAHVRAATSGLSVSDANCHPFVHRRLAFMHNGALGNFHRIRQRLIGELSPEAFSGVSGSTDSEHLMAVFIDRLGARKDELPLERAAAAMQETVDYALTLSASVTPHEDSYLNLAVTDGEWAVVCRVTDADPERARSLYVHSNEPYRSAAGEFATLSRRSTLVSSERLNEDPGWEVVPPNHMVMVQRGENGKLRKVEVARRT